MSFRFRSALSWTYYQTWQKCSKSGFSKLLMWSFMHLTLWFRNSALHKKQHGFMPAAAFSSGRWGLRQKAHGRSPRMPAAKKLQTSNPNSDNDTSCVTWAWSRRFSIEVRCGLGWGRGGGRGKVPKPDQEAPGTPGHRAPRLGVEVWRVPKSGIKTNLVTYFGTRIWRGFGGRVSEGEPDHDWLQGVEKSASILVLSPT